MKSVDTSIPAFVGYTEKAIRDSESLINTPTRIESLAEYHQLFGAAPKTTFEVAISEAKTGFSLNLNLKSQFHLYRSMRLFFSNGGSTCYVVSCGTYDDTKGVRYEDLNSETEEEKGIATLLRYSEPTMLVIPDAVLLENVNDCHQIQQDMLRHCGTVQNRIALLDVYGGDQPRTHDDHDVITATRDGLGNDNLQWGACYYPFLHTTTTSNEEVDYQNISNLDSLTSILNTVAEDLRSRDDETQLIKKEIAKIRSDEVDKNSVHQTLLTLSPMYKSIISEIRDNLNVLPPSGGMAGIISMIDEQVGVFQAPANVTFGSVISPTVKLTSEDQEDLNTPQNGKAVNAIRSFPGKGTLIWGARTLDGNSQDWRYLNVRRTMIMIEQSLKQASEGFSISPNTQSTWSELKQLMTDFLIDLWKTGTLAGATPEDAFSVDVGLGSTMTPEDILNGNMNISVKLALVRPAEFIVITIQQQMHIA